MEPQFNLDLKTIRSVTTLISKGGLSTTPETPDPNLLFIDDEGIEVWGLVQNGQFHIHSKLHNQTRPSMLKKFAGYLEELEEKLHGYGLTEYYTIADSHANFKFCEHFGFHTTYKVYQNKYELMIKEIS